jgi:phosphate transport system permease protein
MVIGSAKGVVTGHLFRPADTIASVIASNFNEAGRGSLEASTLVSLALILVVISLGFAALARLLVRRTTRQARAAMFARGSV